MFLMLNFEIDSHFKTIICNREHKTLKKREKKSLFNNILNVYFEKKQKT